MSKYDQFIRPVQIQLNKKKEFAFQRLIDDDFDYFSNGKKDDLILITNKRDQDVHISPFTSNNQESVLKITKSDVNVSGNANVDGDLNISGYINGSNGLKIDNQEGIDASDGFLFFKSKNENDLDAVAYIHENGLFVGGKLHVNMDFPKYDLDVGGDIGSTHSIFIGRNMLNQRTKPIDYKPIYSWASHPYSGMYNIHSPEKHGIGFDVEKSLRMSIMQKNINFYDTNNNLIVSIDDDGLASSKNIQTSELRVEDKIVCQNMTCSNLFRTESIRASSYISTDNLYAQYITGIENIIGIKTIETPILHVNENIYSSNVTITGDLIMPQLLGIQSPGFVFAKDIDENKEESLASAVTYIHENGLFVGGKLHVNMDFPKYDLDVGGDIGSTHSVFIGRNLFTNNKGKNQGYKAIYSWADYPKTGMYHSKKIENDKLVTGIAFDIDSSPKMEIMKKNVVWRDENQKLISILDDEGTLELYGNLKSRKDILTLSDIRKKENIKCIENVSEKIEKLHGYSFNFKEDLQKKKKLGLLAQEIKEILPEAVTEDNDGYLSVSYNAIIPVMIEYMHEISDKMKNILNEVNVLKEKIEKN